MNIDFIKRVERYIEVVEGNVEFIKKRIAIQNEPYYNPINLLSQARKRHYSKFSLELEEEKLSKAKTKLKFLQDEVY